jgi:hypothetical protein
MGTFRITVLTRDFDSIDPAISYRPTTGALLDPTCAARWTATPL